MREEDNSDGADSYIEQCMGKQEPIEKVTAIVMILVVNHYIFKGTSFDLSAVSCQQWAEAQITGEI